MKKILFTLLLVLGISAAADAQVRFLDSSTDAVRKEAIAQDKLVFIDLYATWCGPCKKIAPIIEELASEYEGRVIIGKCDVDDNDELTSKYGIRNVPTVLFIKDGNVIDKNVGAAPKSDFVEKVEALLK